MQFCDFWYDIVPLTLLSQLAGARASMCTSRDAFVSLQTLMLLCSVFTCRAVTNSSLGVAWRRCIRPAKSRNQQEHPPTGQAEANCAGDTISNFKPRGIRIRPHRTSACSTRPNQETKQLTQDCRLYNSHSHGCGTSSTESLTTG